MGAKTGKLLPTGQAVNIIDDIEVSCIDVSVPVVMMLAASLGKSGYETKQELDQDKNLIKKMEMIRQKPHFLWGWVMSATLLHRKWPYSQNLTVMVISPRATLLPQIAIKPCCHRCHLYCQRLLNSRLCG